jgi:hypothetical protein
MVNLRRRTFCLAAQYAFHHFSRIRHSHDLDQTAYQRTNLLFGKENERLAFVSLHQDHLLPNHLARFEPVILAISSSMSVGKVPGIKHTIFLTGCRKLQMHFTA